MKQAFKPFIYGCIAIAGYIHPAKAQDLAFASTINNDAATLLAITNNPATAGIPLDNVSTKVARIFSKYYKDAENIKWYKSGNNYLAMFDQAGLKSHALYGKGGYWHYDVRFGTEKELPAAVKKVVKSNYIDYDISKATEVNVGNDKAWVVNLENTDNLVIARIIDGRLDEMARYTTKMPIQKLHKKARIVIPNE